MNENINVFVDNGLENDACAARAFHLFAEMNERVDYGEFSLLLAELIEKQNYVQFLLPCAWKMREP